MLFMLLLNSVQSLKVLTFCAQWMALAALLVVVVISLYQDCLSFQPAEMQVPFFFHLDIEEQALHRVLLKSFTELSAG